MLTPLIASGEPILTKMAALDAQQKLALQRLQKTMSEVDARNEIARSRMRCFEGVYRGGAPIAVGQLGVNLWDLMSPQVSSPTT